MNWNELLSGDRIRSFQKSTTTRDLRTEFEKDYHRIIGSASFRRLQDKTQVFPLDKSDYIRTRLTHSLEVSSFAKSLGQNVGEKIIREKKDSSFTIQMKETYALFYSVRDFYMILVILHLVILEKQLFKIGLKSIYH